MVGSTSQVASTSTSQYVRVGNPEGSTLSDSTPTVLSDDATPEIVSGLIPFNEATTQDVSESNQD